jgi:molecular chaperone Hsp33
MVVDGEIEVVCEFCSSDYHFRPHELEDLKH